MNKSAIQSWLNNISGTKTPHQSPQQPLKRNRNEADLPSSLISPMSSSPKRNAPDLDQTPQSLKGVQQQEFLQRNLTFRPSPSPSKRRRASPSKRYTTTASLKLLDPRSIDILHEATEASTITKGESAWNAQVHHPILDLALKPIPAVKPETITNAQIIKEFRFISLDQTWSSASSSAASSLTSGHISEQEASVYKMVDFALVPLPDSTLAFLDKADYSTMNHIMYDALSRRPAPAFIETKTSAGVVDKSHAQLGIWTAAWLMRLRAANSSQSAIGIPVIQVHGDVWTVMFAMDEGDKIVC
ncbi:hypothetical protein HG530_014514 [Fusarium avenaceum]|nr:hypothetical protein HG530_014514 [Fusarium avenaceum]